MALSNQNRPAVKAVALRNSSAVITGGVTSGSVAIAAEIKNDIGVPGNGSLYLSNSGNGEVWVLVSGVWTQLTIN